MIEFIDETSGFVKLNIGFGTDIQSSSGETLYGSGSQSF